MRSSILCFFIFLTSSCFGQLRWQNIDSAFGPLPPTVHVFFTNLPIDTGAFRAYYLIADLKDKHLNFTTDTTLNRRFTPTQFYQKNDQPLVVVNGTFFSFETNRNLNVVVKDGVMIAQNPSVKSRGRDSLKMLPAHYSAIGIRKNRKADVAWIKTDSLTNRFYGSQHPLREEPNFWSARSTSGQVMRGLSTPKLFFKWKMQTAIGGGPVLLQDGKVNITNEFEQRFAGKAIHDKHPRTAMGYTKDNKLIILVVEGRNLQAGGATLGQEAQILKDLGCVEALNLDGGGSSCLLINGRETIKPSDKGIQRAVPAVFLIKQKK